MTRRTVVTGMGIVSSLGCDLLSNSFGFGGTNASIILVAG